MDRQKIRMFIIWVKKLVLVLVPVLLQACVLPNAETYYYPSAINGVVSSKSCVPTNSLLDFTAESDGSLLDARVYAHNRKNNVFIYVGFRGYGWKELQFSSLDFNLFEPESLERFQPSVISISDESGTTDLVAGKVYVNRSARPGVNGLSLWIRFEEALPGKLTLHFPELLLDGKQVLLPVVTLEKKLWVGLSPFNC